MLQRRSLIFGAVAGLITAPAIVRANSIMSIKSIRPAKLLKLYPYQKDIFHFMEHYGTNGMKKGQLFTIAASEGTGRSYSKHVEEFFRCMELRDQHRVWL